jgi:two-component system sensor histidine kinase MtrB
VSLRRTLSIVTVLLTVLALASAASTVLLTNYLDNTVSALRENLESVRIGQQIEIDLLGYSRLSNNSPALAEFEADLGQELARARQYVSTPDEQSTLSDAQSLFDEVMESRTKGATPVELRQNIEKALDDLRQFVTINVRQAHEVETNVDAVNRMAERAATLIALVLVVGIVAILVWLGWYAFRPVFGIGDAMKAFANGDRAARAPEIGTQELRRIAQQFNEMAENLAKQRENQIAFLASVAHDLRNPIGALKMSTSILDPNGPMPKEERTREIFGVVQRQIDHLNRMIGDLLDAYHIQSGQLELRLQQADAATIVRDAYELFRNVSNAHQLSLQVPSTPVPVRCDPLRLSQVLNNLLSNAIKYSPQGGEVVIRLRQRPGQALIEVSDTGMGIAAQDLPHIFEPFRRTGLGKREIPGIGLGLNVVKRIVEAHGGLIEVTSRVGKGTTFIVCIPSMEEQAGLVQKELTA